MRVTWVEADARDAWPAARAVAALLAEVPIPGEELPRALVPSHLESPPVAQVREPLTYRPESGLVPTLPPIKAMPVRTPKPHRRKKERAQIDEVVQAIEGQGVAGGRRRPGTGGRQSPIRAFTVTTATRELYEKYGEPIVSRHGDAQMMVWILNSSGRGIIGARLSTRDVQNGETALGQIHPALARAEALGLDPRLLVVTTENSGGHRYEARCDFDLIEREIYAGRCKWVWFRDVKRLIRNVSPFYRFRDLLLETGTDLWLTDYASRGRAVDWDEDDIQLGIEAIIAEKDRKSIYKQTHGPLMTRWLNEGRGWPGALRFGLRRNALTKYVEQDPEQWPFVRMIHELYPHYVEGQSGGIRAVRSKLRDAGCDLSESTIKRVLADPVYVTGEFTVERAGVLYTVRVVDFKDPVPADLYKRNQELRKQRRGTEEKNPVGTYLLNGIFERSCGCGLRATVHSGRVRYYAEPDERRRVRDCCRGKASIDPDLVESAVVQALRELALSPLLQEEWTALARPLFADSELLLDEGTRAMLEKELAERVKLRQTLTAGFIREAHGEDGAETLAKYERLTAAIDLEVESLKERIATLDVLDSIRRSTRPVDEDPLTDVLLSVLSIERPDDPLAVRKRHAVVHQLLSKVILHDESVPPTIELHGPLVPATQRLVRPVAPTDAARDALVRGVQPPPESRRARAIRVAREESDDERLNRSVTPDLRAGSDAPPDLPKLKVPRAKPRLARRPPDPKMAPAWISSRIPLGNDLCRREDL